MNGEQAIHPARETLAAFGSGRLEPAEAVAVEAHIAECEECCETLLDLGSDTFVDLVRRSDAVHLDSVTDDGTVDWNETETETIRDLPDELSQHPRYRVLELLGKGGMGNVYKAEHTLMNRTVALKVINRELVQNDQVVERFRREVQLAAHLAHPNIVTVYDAEQAGDVHFLVMEYVPGDDLSDVVKREGPLDVAHACDFIRQAANGLQHAHASGMVHRDVKPHNLMVTAAGQVKILDFGLASLTTETRADDAIDERVEQDSNGRPAAHLTSADSMMGTPDFISPEQASDAHGADSRSDIYSLGCTFYYLLTGRTPFTKGSAMERVKAHSEREPEPIENVRGDIPPELAEIVRRMMAKAPAERFQTPADMADALAPFVHRATPAAGQQADTRTRPGASRRSWWPPTIVQSLACAAFALVLAGVILTPVEPKTGVVVREVWGNSMVVNAVSPNGRYLSGVDWVGSEGELSVRDLQSESIRHLTDDAADGKAWAEYSTFSSDGQRLAYSWFNNGSVELRTIGIDGGDPAVIYTSDENTSYIEPMDWSPDGSQVLAVLSRRDNTNQIALISVPAKSVTILKSLDWRYPTTMNFSPDGSYIVYDLPERSDILNRDIFVIATDGTREVRLIEHSFDDALLGWSPDGKTILFASDRTGTWDAWLVSVANGKCQGVPELVRSPIGAVLPLGFTTEGAFFFQSSKRLSEIYAARFDPASGEVESRQSVSQRAFGSNTAPSWSAAGDLAYLSQRGRRTSITTLSASGQEKVLSIQLSYVNPKPPAWSPDGRTLLVSGSNRRSGKGVYLIDANTGAVEQADGNGLAWGEWAPDGDAIFVIRRKDGRIYKRDRKSGREEVIAQAIDSNAPGRYKVRFVVSPNGEQLAYTKYHGDKGTWTVVVKPLDGSDEVMLYNVPEGKLLRRLEWTSDGKSLVIAEFGQDTAEFFLIPVQGGSPRKIHVNVDGVEYVTLHPDGKRIAFSVRQNGTYDVLAMENFLPLAKAK